jgi:hypothetical protein
MWGALTILKRESCRSRMAARPRRHPRDCRRARPACARIAAIAHLGPRPRDGRAPAARSTARDRRVLLRPADPVAAGFKREREPALAPIPRQERDLRRFSLRDLDDIAERINTRPRPCARPGHRRRTVLAPCPRGVHRKPDRSLSRDGGTAGGLTGRVRRSLRSSGPFDEVSISRASCRPWPVRTPGARWAGRPGSLPPSGWLAIRPGQALCPGRCRGIAACPGRRPPGR